MTKDTYTVEEISQLLKVSKLTVYDLIKKGILPAYRVGRQMRVDAKDIDAYKSRGKGDTCYPGNDSIRTALQDSTYQQETKLGSGTRSIIISGQDLSLDILANSIEKWTKSFRPLRSYVGSLDSLISMYLGEADIVSTHLLDGDTMDYNISYVRKILVNESFIVVNLIIRRAGLYVATGNPKKITTWSDLKRHDIRIVNREKGSGARVLLDEQLRIHSISKEVVSGYEHVETNHLGVAGAVANGIADVGIGIEKASKLVNNIEFIPLINERYDLVLLKTERNKPLIAMLLDILQSSTFQKELTAIGGYDLSFTGKILFEN
ncbi:hypothetical protein BHU72_07130 [Desulfuribacillus stibiiarsenatis]|uniref:Excisionase n=1 Tax=Desulfuribacillus stibiiarsenatis TaxID=1390249 RepID=A0A1E5L4B6_9FIRM|nr:helix-turn-helix transcriptional regulator [Desulfuribacillus stibiiarsenatis]OEH84957.1 hypothetical protein BHU72_07130 [Desulfuribacillus stibiiarsenatis]